MVYDAIGATHASIPQLALWEVRLALDAGWRVTCVCRDLDDSLRGQVEHLPLHVPAKLFAVQWLSARRNIKAAIGERRFDVLHAHQPQIAALADVMQCHFLTHAAARSGGLETRHGLKHRVARVQQELVRRAENAYWHALVKTKNPVRLLFVSSLLHREFEADYGAPAHPEVLINACTAPRFPNEQERRTARARWFPEADNRLIIGYLGGLDARKGYRELISTLGKEADQEICLLMGGPNSQGFECPTLGNRFRSVGLVKEMSSFYAACDVVIVPSLFEPFGLVATEATSAGVPVIATPEVGALPHLLEYGAGVAWQPGQPLGALVRDLAGRRAEFNAGARRMAESYSTEKQGARLLQIYDEVRGNKRVKS